MHPEVWVRAYAEATTGDLRCCGTTPARSVVLPHDWLTGRILAERGGFREWTTDRGDASGSGYWSPRGEGYREDLMELALGRTFAVPRVLAPGTSRCPLAPPARS